MTAFGGGLNRSTQHYNYQKYGVLEMGCRTRINYTAEQKYEMWDRCKKGESLKEIGRAFDNGGQASRPNSESLILIISS